MSICVGHEYVHSVVGGNEYECVYGKTTYCWRSKQKNTQTIENESKNSTVINICQGNII